MTNIPSVPPIGPSSQPASNQTPGPGMKPHEQKVNSTARQRIPTPETAAKTTAWKGHKKINHKREPVVSFPEQQNEAIPSHKSQGASSQKTTEKKMIAELDKLHAQIVDETRKFNAATPVEREERYYSRTLTHLNERLASAMDKYTDSVKKIKSSSNKVAAAGCAIANARAFLEILNNKKTNEIDNVIKLKEALNVKGLWLDEPTIDDYLVIPGSKKTDLETALNQVYTPTFKEARETFKMDPLECSMEQLKILIDGMTQLNNVGIKQLVKRADS